MPCANAVGARGRDAVENRTFCPFTLAQKASSREVLLLIITPDGVQALVVNLKVEPRALLQALGRAYSDCSLLG